MARGLGGSELRFFGDQFDRSNVRQMVVPVMDERCKTLPLSTHPLILQYLIILSYPQILETRI